MTDKAIALNGNPVKFLDCCEEVPRFVNVLKAPAVAICRHFVHIYADWPSLWGHFKNARLFFIIN